MEPDTFKPTELNITQQDENVIIIARPVEGAPVAAVVPKDSPHLKPFEIAKQRIKDQAFHPAKQEENLHTIFRKEGSYVGIVKEANEIAAKHSEYDEYWKNNTAPFKEVAPFESTIALQFMNIADGHRPEWFAKATAEELSAVLRAPSLFRNEEQLNLAREEMFRKRQALDSSLIVQAGKKPDANNPARSGVDNEKLAELVDERLNKFRSNVEKLADREAVLSRVIKVAATLVGMQPDDLFMFMRETAKK